MPTPRRRPWTRALAVLLGLALLGAACSDDDGEEEPSGQAEPGDHSGELDNGTTWALQVPDDWNGTLLLYSHGAVPAGNPNPAMVAPDPGAASVLLERGYALGGSSYSHTGWATDTAPADQLGALDEIEAELGAVERTIVWGSSMGGLITAALVEEHPDRFDGGLSLCGPIGGADLLWDTLLDAFFVVQTLIVPGALIVDFPDDGSGSYDTIAAEGPTAQATALGKARFALAAAVGAVPGWSNLGQPRPAATDYEQQYAAQSVYLGTVVAPLGTTLRASLEDAVGGNPSENADVDYAALLAGSESAAEVTALYAAAGGDLQADLARLASTPRVTADPAARATMLEATPLDGGLEIPLLTMHTTGDAAIPIGHATAYADLANAAGTTDLLRQVAVDRPGHCTFTPAEHAAAIDAITARVTEGRWSFETPTALNGAAGALDASLAALPDGTGGTLALPPSFVPVPDVDLPRRAS